MISVKQNFGSFSNVTSCLLHVVSKEKKNKVPKIPGTHTGPGTRNIATYYYILLFDYLMGCIFVNMRPGRLFSKNESQKK